MTLRDQPIHSTRSIKVWVDVDEGVADYVLMLNEIPGVRTEASCQGTIGEGGAAPYPAHVLVSWLDDAARARLVEVGRVVDLGTNHGYVYPPSGWTSPAAQVGDVYSFEYLDARFNKRFNKKCTVDHVCGIGPDDYVLFDDHTHIKQKNLVGVKRLPR